MTTVKALENVLNGSWPNGVPAQDYQKLTQLIAALGPAAWVDVPSYTGTAPQQDMPIKRRPGRPPKSPLNIVTVSGLGATTREFTSPKRRGRKPGPKPAGKPGPKPGAKRFRKNNDKTLGEQVLELLSNGPMGGKELVKKLGAPEPSVYATIRKLKLPVVDTQAIEGTKRMRQIYGLPKSMKNGAEAHA